jgi:hypothetical protein
LAGLRDVIPDGVQPLVFLTRSQLDVAGNTSALADTYTLDGKLYTGGMKNPFDAFDAVGRLDPNRARDLEVLRKLQVEPRVTDIAAKLRLLVTFWGYDERTRTMFTSDAFTHVRVTGNTASPVLDSLARDSTNAADVRSVLLATYWWLEYAETPLIAEWLRETFDTFDVEVIAPSRGCVLKGREVVRHHVDLMVDALYELGRHG